MRIGLVCEDFRWGGYGGGISAYTDSMARSLLDMGHDVHVFRIGLEGYKQHRTPDGIVCHDVPDYNPRLIGWRTVYWKFFYRYWQGYLFNLRWSVALGSYIHRLVRQGALDVLEVPETGARLCWHVHRIGKIIPVCVRLHAPSIITASTTEFMRPRDLAQIARLERRLIEGATCVTAPTHAVVEAVRSQLAVKRTDCTVIPNPVTVPELSHIGLDAWSKPKIVFVGRLEALKGVDALLKAFAIVAQEHASVELELLGPDANQYCSEGVVSLMRRYLNEKDCVRLLPRVRWLGSKPRTECHERRIEAVCVVVPSRFENFPYALVEAMSLGCPVVATRVGGMSEILDNGTNGWLAEPGSPESLAAAIKVILQDPEQAIRVGAAARAWIRRCCDPTVVARQILNCYKQAGAS